MEVEQTQSFNLKLSQWIASQGFWFQLRHSMSGGGGWAMTMNHLVRLGFKVLIALLVAAGGFGIYLVKRVTSTAFVQSLDAGVAKGLGATEAKIVDFSRSQGEVQVRRFGADGGNSCFFRSLEAGNIRFKMGLLDGVTGGWDAGTLIAKRMEIDLKAGANTPEEAAALGNSLFREWKEFRFSSLEVDDATLRWGFSERTAGRIDKSHLTATRAPDGWRLLFKNGTFSQNWLKKLKIVEMEVVITATGLKVIKGDFKWGGGTVVFRDVAATGGEKPVVGGIVEISKVEISEMVPDAVESFIEGVLSGSFSLSGSTNSVEGIQLEGDVTLGGGNLISLREKLLLLNALSVVDVYNSYRKVDLDRGSFHMKTGGGSMKLSRVDLKAGELMTARGALEIHYPREEEMTGPEGINIQGQFAPVFDPNLGAGQKAKGGDGEMSLKKAAKGTASEPDAMAIFDRRNQERISEQLLQEEMARRAQALRCDGGMTITIPGDAFDRSELLREAHPVDPANGRIAIDVPLQGTLFDLTRRQAEELLELGTRR